MIVCSQCQQSYPNGAQWCNHCEIELAPSNSSALFDNQTLKKAADDNQRGRNHAFKAMLAASVAMPMLAIQQAYTGHSVPVIWLLLLSLIGIAAGVAAWAISVQKPWARKMAIAASLAMLMAFPVGTMLAVLLLIFLFSTRWDS